MNPQRTAVPSSVHVGVSKQETGALATVAHMEPGLGPYKIKGKAGCACGLSAPAKAAVAEAGLLGMHSQD